MKFSVYIATSVDGFIARNDGSVDWLELYGNHEAKMNESDDMGWGNFMESVDCLIMGRGSMEMISGMNLASDQWLYGDTRIIVLSNTLKEPPENMKDKVEMYSGDLLELITKLKGEGFKHAYVDGGKTIQSFLNLKLINEMTITQVPVLLGEGKPLFGKTTQDIRLEKSEAITFPNDFVQIHYKVSYL